MFGFWSFRALSLSHRVCFHKILFHTEMLQSQMSPQLALSPPPPTDVTEPFESEDIDVAGNKRLLFHLIEKTYSVLQVGRVYVALHIRGRVLW